MAEKNNILIVDDEPDVAHLLETILAPLKLSAAIANSGEEALDGFQAGRFQLMLTDLNMPGMNGLELMSRVLEIDPAIQVIVMTGDAQKATIDTACQAVRDGAYHFFTKPFNNPRQVQVFVEKALNQYALLHENLSLREELNSHYGLENIIGKSKPMENLCNLIRRVAGSDCTVLILGESGVGKELVAQALHSLSPRARHRLVKVNCHTLAESMLESELFGHAKGSFTGATVERAGLFAAAHHGTILLDEIGDISPELQAKLLRVLETGEIRQVGSDVVRTVAVRVLASTNRNLDKAVREGRFREDLYYRLNVMQIAVPSLRDRLEDIPALVAHFLQSIMGDKPLPRFEPGFLELLMQYDWPGNVRQLRSALERAMLLREGETLYRRHLPHEILTPERLRRAAPEEMPEKIVPPVPVLPLSLEEGEKLQIEKALVTTQGHLSRAAQLLGISRRTLYTKVRRYNLDPKAAGETVE